MFVPTLEDEGALKLFENRFFNKCGGVSHFHSLPLQFLFLFLKKEKKRIEKKRNTTRKRKAKQNKENKSGSFNT